MKSEKISQGILVSILPKRLYLHAIKQPLNHQEPTRVSWTIFLRLQTDQLKIHHMNGELKTLKKWLLGSIYGLKDCYISCWNHNFGSQTSKQWHTANYKVHYWASLHYLSVTPKNTNPFAHVWQWHTKDYYINDILLGPQKMTSWLDLWIKRLLYPFLHP